MILVEGRNAWISMRGELWKAALEQVRGATPEEEEAMGLLKEEFEELKEAMTRRHSKRAYKDISNWEHPPCPAVKVSPVKNHQKKQGFLTPN